MPRTAISLCLLASLLAGCAAAMPGYVPSTPQREKMLAAAPKGGGFDQSGTYALTEQEQKLDCKSLTGGITIKIIQMREASSRATPSAAAKLTGDTWRTVKGGTAYAQDLGEDYRRDRARLETLNGRLVEKGCKSFDIEAELKPGNKDVPKPTVEAKKKG
jgi:hypothetical protein